MKGAAILALLAVVLAGQGPWAGDIGLPSGSFSHAIEAAGNRLGLLAVSQPLRFAHVARAPRTTRGMRRQVVPTSVRVSIERASGASQLARQKAELPCRHVLHHDCTAPRAPARG